MNYKYDDRSFKGIEKMSFQLHCPARQLQRIMNEFEKQIKKDPTGVDYNEFFRNAFYGVSYTD